MVRRSRLHVPKPHSRPGEEPDFSYLQTSPAGAVRAARRQRARARHRQPRGRSRARARRPAPGRGTVAPAPRDRRAADRPAPHAAHARLRRSHAAHAAAGQDFVLHALARRGSRVGRAVHGVATHRHAVPVVSQPGFLHGARAAAGRPHVPAALEHARHVQGPAVAGDVSVGRGPHLLDLGQPDDAVPAGRRLGDGRGDEGHRRHRRQLDRRGLERRGRFPPRDAVRIRVPGAGDPERRQQPVGDLDVPGFRGRRAALVRGAWPRVRHGRHPRRRQRLPRRVCGHAVGGASARAPARVRR